MKRARSLAVALVLLGCSSESERRPPHQVAPAPVTVASSNARAVRYVALGDSFTAGTGASLELAFPKRLAARAEARGCTVELQNLAVNGFRTDHVMSVELPRIHGPPPDWVTLAIGANDIVAGRTVEAYRANVRAIVDDLVGRGIAGRALVAIPQPRWSETPVGRSFGSPSVRIDAFDAALREEVERAGGRYVDLGARMVRQSDANMVADDGLHPNAAAYDEWAADLDEALAWPCAQVTPQTSATR